MIFFLQFEATPTANHPLTNKLAGAIVDCWIEAESLEAATATAKKSIIAEGWIIDDPDKAFADTSRLYEANSPHRRYYEQALLDGEVLVFHTYPVDEHLNDLGSSSQ